METSLYKTQNPYMITDERLIAAELYETEIGGLYLPLEATWKSRIGTAVQQRCNAVMLFARRMATAPASQHKTFEAGSMLKAVRADVTPVNMYRNTPNPYSALNTRPVGSGASPAPPATMAGLRVDPIVRDSTYNVALKYIPGYSMAAATQTALELLETRSQTHIKLPMQLAADEREFAKYMKPLPIGPTEPSTPSPIPSLSETTSPTVLYASTPVGFALIFPAISSVVAGPQLIPDAATYKAFLDANSAVPFGFGANEFCDTVSAAFGAEYTLAEVLAHYNNVLDKRKNLLDIQEDLHLDSILEPFLTGLGLVAIAVDPKDPKRHRSSIDHTTVHITDLFDPANRGTRPRVRTVCPIPFVYYTAFPAVKTGRNPLINQLMAAVKGIYQGEGNVDSVNPRRKIFPSGTDAGVYADWVTTLDWRTKVTKWIEDIYGIFAQKLLLTRARSAAVSPEREFGARCIPFPTQRNVARIVSDKLVLSDIVPDGAPPGAVLLATDVVYRTSTHAIVICGSTRIWRKSESWTLTSPGAAGGSTVSLDANQFLGGTTALPGEVQRTLPYLALTGGFPLLDLDVDMFGDAYGQPGLLIPSEADIDYWFSSDENIHYMLENPSVSHYLDFARNIIMEDSHSTLAGQSITLIELQGIPEDKLASPQARAAAQAVAIEFGRLAESAWRTDLAESNIPANELAVRLCVTNTQECRRRLAGLQKAVDPVSGIEYLRLAQQSQWLPSANYTAEGGPFATPMEQTTTLPPRGHNRRTLSFL